jgi:D-3-phosphoglycerate dehydrogenase
MKKIVVSGERFFMKFGDLSYFERRAREAGATIVPVDERDDGVFGSRIADAAAVVVIDRRIGPDVIRGLGKCEILMALSVGYDCIDVGSATERGIPVCHVPAYCTDDVATHAIALLLAVARKVVLFSAELKKGNWDYNFGKPMYNLRGRMLGIIGLGRIGRAVVPKAKGFGMNVSAYDPYLDDDIFENLGVSRKGELADLLRDSDFITVHAPLTEETRNMIDAEALGMMKTGAVLVNTARGNIVDEKALLEALERRRISGAGLDVVAREPAGRDNPFLACGNAVVTPHVAWYSEESLGKAMVMGMDEVVSVLGGRRPRYVVNPQVLWKRKVQ